MIKSGIERTVQELADKEEIRDLARRYAHYVWQEDGRGAAALFAEDGEMDLGGQTIKGRKALLEAYGSMVAGRGLLPFVHDHVVELSGDTATGRCHLDLRASMDGKSMMGAGVYDDRYVRTPEGWKFQSRKLALRYFVPLEEGWAEKKT
jgi:ketosteroid isomerase-like protein